MIGYPAPSLHPPSRTSSQPNVRLISPLLSLPLYLYMFLLRITILPRTFCNFRLPVVQQENRRSF